MVSKNKRMIRTTSRGRSTAMLKAAGAEAVRVRTWFSYVLERVLGAEVDAYAHAVAGDALGFSRPKPDLVAALEAWLSKQVDADLGKLTHAQEAAVTRLKRNHYEDGRQSPTDLTLSLFESFLPGSREVYEVGPQSLPLWAVLEGDLKVCEDYLVQLQTPKVSWIESGFGERIKLNFDALIAPAYRLPWTRVPDLGREQQTTHPVLLTHWQAQREGLFDAEHLPEVRVIDDQIVGAIALWRIALHRRDNVALHLEWLLMGLCSGVVAEHFNEAIQVCLLGLLREQGKELDIRLRDGGINVQSFEARWDTVTNAKEILKENGLDPDL